MSKHTPGPWETGRAAWDEDGDVMYSLHGIKEATVADCRLIAAAPDLLEALKPFEDLAQAILSESPAEATYFSVFQDCEGVSHRIDLDELRAVSAAIAKAEGRS
jgi:hypothetical protein